MPPKLSPIQLGHLRGCDLSWALTLSPSTNDSVLTTRRAVARHQSGPHHACAARFHHGRGAERHGGDALTLPGSPSPSMSTASMNTAQALGRASCCRQSRPPSTSGLQTPPGRIHWCRHSLQPSCQLVGAGKFLRISDS
jgi:hypothetical protein